MSRLTSFLILVSVLFLRNFFLSVAAVVANKFATIFIHKFWKRHSK